MPANLTPQYLKAEEQYRRASTPEEELKWLQVMLSEIPKHKGTEKLQSDLKSKISKLKKELQSQKKKGGARRSGLRIPRQGAGTVVLLGGPNAGKSQLLRALTRATPEVAPWPFTTQQPTPGMMPWEDVMVQLIDTPPITEDFMEPYMHGLIRGADLALLVLGLEQDEEIEAAAAVLQRLVATKTRLARRSYLDENDVGISYTQTFLVANKIDAPEAEQRLQLFLELHPVDFPIYRVSATQGTGLEELRDAIYRALDVVRVYTKEPSAREPDMERPFTIKRGRTLRDVAAQVHKDFVEKFKFAKVWGSKVHDGTVVKDDYVPEDRDIVEFHID